MKEHSKRRRAPGKLPREVEAVKQSEIEEKPLAASATVPDVSDHKRPPTTLGESATQFARGFAKGVGEESRQIYKDTKELPARLAKAGREAVEDVEAGRELRALAPLRAATHAVRHASRDDAKRIAQAVVDGAVEWYHKPAYEKGQDLGRATTSITAEAAINVLTDGLGTLRKIEKAAEVADHFRDFEKGAEQAAHAAEHLRDVERAVDKAAGNRLRPRHDGLGDALHGEHSRPGSYTPDRTLPTDKQGIPLPDSPYPHTQLGRSKPKYGDEPQAREWNHGKNDNLQPTRDIDFTDHGSPSIHPKPHQHSLTPNNPTLAPQGGFRRGSPEPL